MFWLQSDREVGGNGETGLPMRLAAVARAGFRQRA
jgi:hypothetical protein